MNTRDLNLGNAGRHPTNPLLMLLSPTDASQSPPFLDSSEFRYKVGPLPKMAKAQEVN
jgi:hypothetical protein